MESPLMMLYHLSRPIKPGCFPSCFPQDATFAEAGVPWEIMGLYMSHETTPGWLGYIGDYTTQFYIGIIMHHCKDPY